MKCTVRTGAVSECGGRKESDGITEFEEFTVNANGGNSITSSAVGATAFVVVCG